MLISYGICRLNDGGYNTSECIQSKFVRKGCKRQVLYAWVPSIHGYIVIATHLGVEVAYYETLRPSGSN
jgi:hypothetical protein